MVRREALAGRCGQLEALVGRQEATKWLLAQPSLLLVPEGLIQVRLRGCVCGAVGCGCARCLWQGGGILPSCLQRQLQPHCA